MTSTKLTFEDMVERLRRNDPSLTRLDMDEVQFPDDCNDDDSFVSALRVFADALKKNTVLTKLICQGLELEDESAGVIAGALKENTTLKELDFECNNIGNQGAVAIAGALEKNTILEKLDLRTNDIGNEGAVAIAGVLEKNSSITLLSLADNEIEADGARALADALKENSTLTELSLGIIEYCGAGTRNTNSIRDEGARAFADALEKNTSLTILDMADNEIGDEGAWALADALEKNATLTRLVLYGNKIGDVGARALAHALLKNSTLELLGLWGNKIGDVGVSALDDAILYNTTILNLNLGTILNSDSIGANLSLDFTGEMDASASPYTHYMIGRIEGTLRRNRVQGIDREKLKAEIIAEEEEKKRKAEEEAVPIIAPTECKIMVSFNDSSAGEDAEKLANYLTRNGHPTFCTRLYCPGMTGSWRQITTKGVRSCKYYIMLLTKGWQESKECQFETNIAVNCWAKEKLTPIPVWYEDFDFDIDKEGDGYDFMFGSIQSVKRKHATWMQVILNQLRGQKPARKQNQKRPPVGTTTSQKRMKTDPSDN